jgi:hypothetical protein
MPRKKKNPSSRVVGGPNTPGFVDQSTAVKCENCLYYREGECWKFPPVWVDFLGGWTRPDVELEDFCSFFYYSTSGYTGVLR